MNHFRPKQAYNTGCTCAESLHENKAIKMPFTPLNWYIWVFLLLLCQTSNSTTFLLKTFSDPLNFNPSVDDDKWWPLLPSSPTQNNVILCPEMPKAYLRFEFNSLQYCISFPLKLLDRDFYLFMYLFWGQKNLLVPLTWLCYYTVKEPLWTESGKRSCASTCWRAE